jgi:hypothetical protein
MIRKLAAVVLLAVSALSSGAVSAHAAAVHEFHGSHSRLWWDGATCREFAVYERTGRGGAFHSMVVDSRRADTYLRSDVGLWAHDARSGAPRSVIGADASYVALDCAGSYGL